jgi:hypothetical protein
LALRKEPATVFRATLSRFYRRERIPPHSSSVEVSRMRGVMPATRERGKGRQVRRNRNAASRLT